MKRRKFMAASAGLGAAVMAASWSGACGKFIEGAMQRSDSAVAGKRLYRGVDLAFGTSVCVQVLHDNEKEAELAIEDAFAEARKIDTLMSVYREGSEVFTLNATGSLDYPSAHLLTVLQTSQTLSQLTEGAFDVTVQPIWNAYNKAFARGGQPGDAEREEARALAGWQELMFDEQRVELSRKGMEITLNGIAQGYATDLAMAAVRSRGVAHALMDIGEHASLGMRAEGCPWTLGIQDPRKDALLEGMLRMDGRAVATSGDYETRFSADFSQHHIFDPGTGYSPAELASVTVVAPTATLADGLSTAMMVMGRDKAMALAARLERVDAMLIDKTGKQWQTSGFPWS